MNIDHGSTRDPKNIIDYCYYPWLSPKVVGKFLLLKLPQIQDLQEYTWKPPLEDTLSHYLKVLCKIPREESSHKFYPGVKLMNHSNNKHRKIVPVSQ